MIAMPRNRRYPVKWPLQYRRPGDPEWRPGVTVNMSVSGVLFQAEGPLAPEEALELSIIFQTAAHPSSVVNAIGHVVRTEQKTPTVIAVKFAS